MENFIKIKKKSDKEEVQESEPKKEEYSLLLDDGNAQDRQEEILFVKETFPEIVSQDKKMISVLTTVGKIAFSSSSVLILGESGTGKELIASSIHRLSKRSYKKFLAINCSAIPEELLEAELFGHEKGAFTGADRRRLGLFEVADEGTLFLDEVGDMPPRLQAKLLRVLQEKNFSPVGSNETKPANVRILAATNKNLEMEVKQGRFRLDLYYRLNVLPIFLPPLRERKGDIPLLVEHFLNRSFENHHSPPCFFRDEALDVLCQCPWPGNIRQLQNVIERLCIIKSGLFLGTKDLPEDIMVSESIDEKSSEEKFQEKLDSPHVFSEGFNLQFYLNDLENKIILEALKKANFNKNRAANILGLNRTTLVEKIKKRGLLKV